MLVGKLECMLAGQEGIAALLLATQWIRDTEWLTGAVPPQTYYALWSPDDVMFTPTHGDVVPKENRQTLAELFPQRKFRFSNGEAFGQGGSIFAMREERYIIQSPPTDEPLGEVELLAPSPVEGFRVYAGYRDIGPQRSLVAHLVYRDLRDELAATATAAFVAYMCIKEKTQPT